MVGGSRAGVSMPTFVCTETFAVGHTVTLGGKRVTMIHLGTAHSDDSSVLHFPDEHHWIQKSRNSILWYDTVLSWLDRWCKQASARPGQP